MRNTVGIAGPAAAAPAVAAALIVSAGCTLFDDRIVVPPECLTNLECTERASSDGSIPSVCVQQGTPRCAPLLSEDCQVVTGNWQDDNALWIASLLGTTGSQAAANLPRQDAAIMALEEINAAGGIPGENDTSRPLVMLSCDVAADRTRAADHIINTLKIPAIVGPNSSADVYAITDEHTSETKPVMLTPTAFAAAIVELGSNRGLTRLMVPADKQRIELFKDQIAEVEAQLAVTRPGRQLKLAIYYRNDLTGQGTRDGLASLRFNNLSLTDNLNNGTAISVGYDPVAASVAGWRDTETANLFVVGDATRTPPAPAFRPDVIVVISGVEAAAGFYGQLEDTWQAMAPGTPKPYWIVADALRVGPTLSKIGGGATVNDSLRLRTRGVSLIAGEGQPAYDVFQQRFSDKYRDKMYPSTVPGSIGMGPIYDAVYAVAFGMAAMRVPATSQFVRHPTGADVARGMDTIGDTSPTATEVLLTDSADLVAALRELRAGNPIRTVGTFGPLKWDTNGAKATGTVDIWCVSAPPTATVSSFKESTVVFDTGALRYVEPNIAGQYFTLLPPPAAAGDRGPPLSCPPLNKLPD